MKSDEEFIAGIYKKAEERKTEEEKTAQGLHNTGRVHHFGAWKVLAAAACLCLIVSGAVYAGNKNPQPGEEIPVQQRDGAVMALSLEDGEVSQGGGDGDMPRLRERVVEDGGSPAAHNAKSSGTQNAVADAMYAGYFLACSQENSQDILPGENGTTMPEMGGN